MSVQVIPPHQPQFAHIKMYLQHALSPCASVRGKRDNSCRATDTGSVQLEELINQGTVDYMTFFMLLGSLL